jgi:glycosyltransferase involved in cell wall biosynthesis
VQFDGIQRHIADTICQITTTKAIVAVDANPATKAAVTGTERYTREVIRRLPEVAPDLDWRFYAARPAPGLGVDLTVLPFPRLWSQARLPAELASRRPDLFLDLAHVVPAVCPAPALKVFHDLAFERFPGAYRPAERAYLRWTARWAARVCPTMIAVSEATRQDLLSLYGVDPGRVTVVHEGGGELTPVSPGREADAARLRGFGIDSPYVLNVGRVEPRKNQLTALEAVERVPGLLLVCAGAIHDEAMAAVLDKSIRCRLLGRVSDAERDLLYRNAEALLFPSLYEGFGLPVLEAMSHGLPVVATRTSSLPEVGGEAAIYVLDPRDSESMATAVRRVREDAGLRRRLVAAGRRQAAGFTWNRCAEGVAEAVRARLSSPAPARSGKLPSPR